MFKKLVLLPGIFHVIPPLGLKFPLGTKNGMTLFLPPIFLDRDATWAEGPES